MRPARATSCSRSSESGSASSSSCVSSAAAGRFDTRFLRRLSFRAMPLGTPASLLFHRIAASRPDPAGLEWLRGAADRIAGGDLEPAGPAFVSAGRHLGRAPLAAGEPLPGSSDPVPTEGWTVDDAARVVLLLAAGDPGLIDTLYREGDSREKRAVLRALPFLDGGERFV